MEKKREARQVADKNYYELRDFLLELQACLSADAAKDAIKGRKKLADALYKVSRHISRAYSGMHSVINACKGHIKEPSRRIKQIKEK